LVPCPKLVLSSLELSAHAFQALESSRHAGEGLPCCPVTSSGSSGAVNGRAGETYKLKHGTKLGPTLYYLGGHNPQYPEIEHGPYPYGTEVIEFMAHDMLNDIFSSTTRMRMPTSGATAPFAPAASGAEAQRIAEEPKPPDANVPRVDPPSGSLRYSFLKTLCLSAGLTRSTRKFGLGLTPNPQPDPTYNNRVSYTQ